MPSAAPSPARRAVAILNQKGGVGKTTVTLGLASAAAAAGRRVLVVDLDPQASSTWVLGHDPVDGDVLVADVLAGAPLDKAIVATSWDDAISLVPGSAATAGAVDREGTARLRSALAAIPADAYDAILLDCPPTLGGATLSALTVARHALIVVDPSALGLRGIGSVADAVDGVWDGDNPDLDLCGVVVNRVPAVSARGRPPPRGAGADRRPQHDLEAAGPPARDRQPGPRRAPADPRLRHPRRRRHPRLRRALETPPQDRPLRPPSECFVRPSASARENSDVALGWAGRSHRRDPAGAGRVGETGRRPGIRGPGALGQVDPEHSDGVP